MRSSAAIFEAPSLRALVCLSAPAHVRVLTHTRDPAKVVLLALTTPLAVSAFSASAFGGPRLRTGAVWGTASCSAVRRAERGSAVLALRAQVLREGEGTREGSRKCRTEGVFVCVCMCLCVCVCVSVVLRNGREHVSCAS